MEQDSEARRRFILEIGYSVEDIGHALKGLRRLSCQVVGLSIRGPDGDREDILITVRGVDEEGAPVVAFFSGPHLGGLLVGVETAIRQGKFRWRPDEFRR